MTIEHQHGITSKEAIVGPKAAAAAYIALKDLVSVWSQGSSKLDFLQARQSGRDMYRNSDIEGR